MAGGSPGPPITIAGFQCWDESAYETVDLLAGMQCFRTILCNWSDRIKLMTALTGSPQIPGQKTDLPLPYPDFPNAYVYKVTSAIQPGEGGLFKGANGMVAGKYARLTVEYKPQTTPGISVNPPSLPSGLPNLIECDFECDVFQKPGGSLKFASGATSSDPFALMVPTARLTIPRSGLIDFDGTRLFRFLGTVNNADFYGSNEECTLFIGAPTSQRYSPSGTLIWDRKFVFKTRSNDTKQPTFNQGWNVTIDDWDVYDPKPFTLMNFITLLTP